MNARHATPLLLAALLFSAGGHAEPATVGRIDLKANQLPVPKDPAAFELMKDLRLQLAPTI